MASRLPEIAKALYERVRREMNREYDVPTPEWMVRLQTPASGGGPASHPVVSQRGLEGEQLVPRGAQGPPYDSPQLVPDHKCGRNSKWTQMAEFILNADFLAVAETSVVTQRVELISGRLSDLSDPGHEDYVPDLQAYVNSVSPAINPAGFTRQALHGIWAKYDSGELRPMAVEPWW